MEIIQEVRTIVRSWEEVVQEGMNAREDKDANQWKLGDLAVEVSTSYGEDSIGKYAYAVGVVKKTIMNYRTVSARYGPEIRNKYKKLSYTHFSTLAPLEEPEAWLIKADDNDWSVETMKTELKKELGDTTNIKDIPPKIYRCPECGMWRLKDTSIYEICRGHYHVENGKTVFI